MTIKQLQTDKTRPNNYKQNIQKNRYITNKQKQANTNKQLHKNKTQKHTKKAASQPLTVQATHVPRSPLRQPPQNLFRWQGDDRVSLRLKPGLDARLNTAPKIRRGWGGGEGG